MPRIDNNLIFTARRPAFVLKRLVALVICVLLFFAIALPATAAYAQKNEQKVVYVGWFRSPFNDFDEAGRRTGYSYEYQRKIAAYTGWKYEYVEGTWSELMQKLKKGEIDLMSDVSFTEDRTEYALYPSLPMGTESYYVYVATNNTRITSDNYSSLNGKKIGVTEGSIQQTLFENWMQEHGITAEIVLMSLAEEQSLDRILSGELDAFVTIDSYGDTKKNVPVFKIGSSDFYFVVNKSRQDLLTQLEAALSRIQDENRYYNEQLFEKYLRKSGTDLYLNVNEASWLLRHGTIRVGYQDNYLAFCASDPKTGALTGALKDYLEYASTALVNTRVTFEAIAYPTAAAAMEALDKGEVDCMFPANLTDHDSETMGVVMSPALMRTEMDAVVRASEQKEFVKKENVVVAVNEGNPNYDLFLETNYPGWETVHYVDTPTCLDAVAAGNADCIIISNYRFGNISKQCEKLHLTTVYTGVDMDYCFAIKQGNTTLYSVLARVINAVPDSIVHTALTYYSTEDVKKEFIDFIKDNLAAIIIGISVIVAVILALIFGNIHATKKVSEEERLVNDLNKRVFVDALTSVRNKASFYKLIEELQKRLDNGEKLEFAVGVFDCDELKKINDSHGHDKGDAYLKTAAKTICGIFKHSPVFRIGGDEFAVVLMGEDYVNRNALVESFDEAQRATFARQSNEWDRVSVAVGIAVYDPDTDRSIDDVARRADKIMYENKRLRKQSK